MKAEQPTPEEMAFMKALIESPPRPSYLGRLPRSARLRGIEVLDKYLKRDVPR
jgi:hypothetical protein